MRPPAAAVCPPIASVPEPLSQTLRVRSPGLDADQASAIAIPLTASFAPATTASVAGALILRSVGVGGAVGGVRGPVPLVEPPEPPPLVVSATTSTSIGRSESARVIEVT